MANAVAVLVYETSIPIAFTVSDAASIEKGDFLQLTDPMTVSLISADNQVVAGIAAEEKIASDGKVKVGVYRGGIFKVVASGSITAGKACSTSGNNLVQAPATNDEAVLGIALETVSTGESFLMELRPTAMELA
jgi:hypothetical protein